MYCRRCGKFINGNATVCNECVEEMLKNEHSPTEEVQAPTVAEAVEVKEETVQVINVDPFESNDGQSATVVVMTERTAQPKAVYNPTPVVEQKGSRKAGLGKAIAAAAIPEVMAAIMTVGLEIFTIGQLYSTSMAVGIGVMFLLVALAGDIVAIILGAQSVNLANSLAREGKKRPIATMICGIVGIAAGASMIFTLITYAAYFLLLL